MWLEQLVVNVLNRYGRNHRPTRPSGLTVGSAIVQGTATELVWPDARRCEHAVVIGKTGSGKTHFLELLAWQIAQRGEGLCFFDFHGDASLTLIERLRSLPGAADRLVVLDPSHPTRSSGINVLESGPTEAERFRKTAELSAILRHRWGVDSFGARTEELLRNSLYTLASAGATLAEFPRLLSDVDFRQELTRSLEHPDVQSYWRDRFEPLSEPMKAAFREPLLNRVTAFLSEPAARHLLSQPESSIDVSSLMDRQRWLIVRLPKGQLREHAHTLGNLLFAQLQFAVLARGSVPRSKRHTFTLLCDEVQNLAENDLATLLTEGRKFGVSVITANQYWEQLPPQLRGALLSAASHVVFRISSHDANVLAAELSLERRSRLARDLTELPRGEAFAKFGADQPHRVHVPPLPSVKPITMDTLTELIAPITRERSDVEADLRRRHKRRPVPGLEAQGDIQEGQHGW